MKKRLLSALLAVSMMLSLFPTSAFADGEPHGGGVFFGRIHPDLQFK